MSKAQNLKEEGNRHFADKDYVGAEGYYSKAIIADPRSPSLYTNRALVRLRLELWESAVADCQACLGLDSSNMKAHYYLAQAQLALRQYDDATASALRAHELCAATGDKSLGPVTALVLRCKKERWDALERKRLREGQMLENELVDLLAREREAMMAAEEGDEAVKGEIAQEFEGKIAAVRELVERARAADQKRRTVPDWAIDDISFGIMVDPVITKTGKSYERASIIEHLRRHPTDPLTREPLTVEELRPNLGLKQACEEFLAENGWAVDW